MTEFVKSGVLCMIFCCGGFHTPFRTVILPDTLKYRERKLEVLICPKCGALIAELRQFNIKKQKYELYRPKRKHTSVFLKKIASGKWDEIKVKFGTKERSGFVFGVNREYKSGKICQYAVDFNGQKKLVKVING